MHLSDLPEYAGGSPLQHQILDGLEYTKMTLFKVNQEIDEGDIIYKLDLDISSGISKIFQNLSNASYELLKMFIVNYPNIELKKQNKINNHHRKRLKPEDSELRIEDVSNMNTKQLYDMIRCREYPYPNVFIEDEFGKILFSKVEYIKK